MLKWILQDTKRTLKSRKVVFLLLVIIVSILVTTNIGSRLNSYETTRTIVNDDGSYQMMVMPNLGSEVLDIHSELKGRFLSTCTGDKQDPIQCAGEIEYNRRFSIYDNSIHIFDLESEDVERDYYSLVHIYLTNIKDQVEAENEDYQFLLKPKLLDYHKIDTILNYIETQKLHEPFPYQLQTGFISPIIFSESMVSIATQLYYHEHSIPDNFNIVNSAAYFLATYLQYSLMLIVFIAIVIIFDSLYKDYQSGVIKTIMSSPKRRVHYFILKFSSAMLSITIVVLIPLLLMSIILYLMEGVIGLGYPIQISRSSLTGFIPFKQYTAVVNLEKPAADFSTYQTICNIGPITQYVSDIATGAFAADTPCLPDFTSFMTISLGQYLILILVHLILLIALLASINNLMSLYVKSALINIVVLCSIVGISLFMTDLNIGKAFLKFLPFTFMNGPQLLMETIPYTYLNGIFTLGGWLILINGWAIFALKRHDFSD